jgi:uncharacterized protein
MFPMDVTSVRQELFPIECGHCRISAVVHLPARPAPPVVITCHGLFSSKDSEKFIAIAGQYARAGFGVVRFDFSGCGASSGDIADTTISRRYRELCAVADRAARDPRLGSLAGLVGSSLGGFLALLFAAQHTVKALSLWATPCALADIWPKVPARDRARLNEVFFRDAASYCLENVAGVSGAVQILHGESDELVPCRHARDLFTRAGEPKMLRIYPGGDHSFTDARIRAQAVRDSLSWFTAHAGSDPPG